MISVEQIRTLESKVQKAVALLGALQEENALLKSRLGEYETRIDELEFLIEEFKEDQSEIEQGIISALNKLDSLESATRQTQTPPVQQPVVVDPNPVQPEILEPERVELDTTEPNYDEPEDDRPKTIELDIF